MTHMIHRDVCASWNDVQIHNHTHVSRLTRQSRVFKWFTHINLYRDGGEHSGEHDRQHVRQRARQHIWAEFHIGLMSIRCLFNIRKYVLTIAERLLQVLVHETSICSRKW